MTEEDISDFVSDYTPSNSLALHVEKLCRYLHAQGFNQAFYSFTSNDEGFEFNHFSVAKPGSEIDYNKKHDIFEVIEIAPGITVQNLNKEIHELLCNECLDEFDNDEFHQEICLYLLADDPIKGQSKWRMNIEYAAEKDKSDDQEFEYSAGHYEEDSAHALIVKYMREKSLDQYHFTFGGGGDSGELHNIECELEQKDLEIKEIEMEDGSKTSFLEIAYDFCNREAQSIGNWWDNDGGSGSIFMMANGDVKIEVSFFEREVANIFKEKEINTPFSIKTGIKIKEPKVIKSLEN